MSENKFYLSEYTLLGRGRGAASALRGRGPRVRGGATASGRGMRRVGFLLLWTLVFKP